MRSRRKQCGAPLLQKVHKNNNHVILRPFKIYTYHPISNALSCLFNHTGFATICEHWRQRHEYPGYMTDVYDGRLWEEWQVMDGRDFLASPFSLDTTIYLDWFQPFTHVNYFVGVLYMVILNLPREQLTKLHNTCNELWMNTLYCWMAIIYRKTYERKLL